jgi:hypothetical protein
MQDEENIQTGNYTIMSGLNLQNNFNIVEPNATDIDT